MPSVKLVFISIQSSDSVILEKTAVETAQKMGYELDIFSHNSDEIDEDPLLYNELVRRTKVADFVLIRCMADPTRMLRFEKYENVLKEYGVNTLLFAGSLEVRLVYRELFKGDDEEYIDLCSYAENRGNENDALTFRWIFRNVTGINDDIPRPVRPRDDGIYHPGMNVDISREEYMKTMVPGIPTVGILFTANLWIYDNMAHLDVLIEELEKRGMNTIPVFFNTRIVNEAGEEGTKAVIRKYFMDGERPLVNAMVMVTPFSQLNNSRDVTGVKTPDEQNFFHTLTDVPVFQAMSISGHYADYEESTVGLSKRELNSSVLWPEIDGQIITVPIGSVEKKGRTRKYEPIRDRIESLADTVSMWAKLSFIPRSERRIAILLYQSRPESGHIGASAGLDSIESVRDMIQRYSELGYTVDHVPVNGKDLINEILDGITNDLEYSSSERIREKAVDMMTKKEYLEHFNALTDFNRKQMLEHWGEPPGTQCVEGKDLVIPGILNGNIFVGYQPMRAWADKMEAVYHDPVIPMTHQYLAYYKWLKYDFKANVIFHIGTHGTLEWLPGKTVAMSGKCYPAIVLDNVPNIYPYVIDDPGEGIQCKRRIESVLIGHMCPTMARADVYEELGKIDTPLQEFFKVKDAKGDKRNALAQQVLEGIRSARMMDEFDIPEDISIEDFIPYTERIHDYLMDLKDTLVRDGLHILGRAPTEDQLDEMVYSVMRMRNGDIPSMRAEFFRIKGYDIDQLLENLSDITNNEVNSAIVDTLDTEFRSLLNRMRGLDHDSKACVELFEEHLGTMTGGLKKGILYTCDTLVPNLARMTDEIDNLMHGCDGGYVLPGPSGAPTRGNAHILPMGRNFYGIDPDIVPPPSSWEIGKKMADQMIERYVEQKGSYPKEVGFIIWATDTMKTNGDDVAYILWLMGVKPVWASSGGQVIGLEVIPLEELGRPRIDVTVRITGLFRDTFPNLIDLIDDAVKMVMDLDEDDEDNNLAANLRREIIEGVEKGLTVDEARKNSSIRIFGCPPGGYGAGVQKAIETGDWKTVEDLADIYITWGSYAYGRGMQEGVSKKEEFVRRFSRVDATIKNMPDREIDVLDTDDVYGYLGGLNSFVRAYGKKDALTFVGDGSDPDKVKIRDTREEINFAIRSKMLNPKFIEGLKRHGYAGVAEVAKLTEYTFGWDATSDVIDDWVYDKITEKYLLDEDNREWMKDENPHAMMDMINRLMEAYERGMWDASDDMIEKLKDIYLDLEERIEEVNDR